MNSLTTSASPFSAAYQSFLRFSSCGDDASEGRWEERRASRTVSSSEGGFLASFLGGMIAAGVASTPSSSGPDWIRDSDSDATALAETEPAQPVRRAQR